MDEKQETSQESTVKSYGELAVENPQETNKPSKTNKFKNTLKHAYKYWYVFLVLLIVIAGAGLYIASKNNTNKKWARAQEYFTKAEYDKAAKEIENMPIPSAVDKLNMYSRVMHATGNSNVPVSGVNNKSSDTEKVANEHLDKALKAYAKLYDLQKDPQTKIMIANIYMQQKKYDEAAKVLNEVIASNPTMVQAYVNLATMYRLQAKQSDAVAITKKGIEANPKDISLNELLVGLLLTEKGSQAYKQAVDNLKATNPSSELLKAI